MVLAIRRPRTVVGCLVGQSCPLSRSGHTPRSGLPAGLADAAVPQRSAPAAGCSGGSSPVGGPLAHSALQTTSSSIC